MKPLSVLKEQEQRQPQVWNMNKLSQPRAHGRLRWEFLQLMLNAGEVVVEVAEVKLNLPTVVEEVAVADTQKQQILV
jgi:hypothetical protein